MDGNGRWAKKRFLPKSTGHRKGADTLLDIAKYCNTLGVSYLTVYAFSTENWKRDKKEVDYLMKLLESYLDKFASGSNDDNMKIKVIGDITFLSETLQEKIKYALHKTHNNTGLTTIIAINYGGRNEIIRSIKKLIIDYNNKYLDIDDIDEKTFSDYLDTKGIVDPDILIRTSNELRLSNFLLWQVAYSEMYFTEKLWPDFSRKDLDKALSEYKNRERRFGGR